MKTINMNELDYDLIQYVDIKLLPCEVELLIRGLETYMFIFHNIYSQHDSGDEQWARDFLAMNLYQRLMTYQKTDLKTSYDVFENCEKHANREKQRVWWNEKNKYKKVA